MALLTPLISTLPPLDLNKKDNTCLSHIVPGWSTTKVHCPSVSGTCLLTCLMDCAVLVWSEVLKSLDWDLRLQPSLICQLLSPNSHLNPQGLALYALRLALCVVFCNHLFVLLRIWSSILPLWHIPLNVFNLAAFPNKSQIPPSLFDLRPFFASLPLARCTSSAQRGTETVWRSTAKTSGG